MDLFSLNGLDTFGLPALHDYSPLAVRMRPQTLDDLVGQNALTAPNSPLRALVEGKAGAPGAVFLWGPPGSGKTTLAYLVARSANRDFVEISAVNSGVKEIREVINQAKRKIASGQQTVLFIDEVHRFSKTQQDVLLPAVENRWVVLVAATTENPAFSVVTPLISRSILVTLKPLDAAAIETVISRAIESEAGIAQKFFLPTEAKDALVRLASGDARKALTILEAAAGAAVAVLSETTDIADINEKIEINLETVKTVAQQAVVQYDASGDQHYDVTSAFIKSVRGSDVDAALHYLARMLLGGEDPRFIARRLVILASEDIGMADPSALQTATAAMLAVEKIGMPEARLTLAQATIALAIAPKSNRTYLALQAALRDVEAGLAGSVPVHLRDAHYAAAKKIGHGLDYKYAHDYPHGVAKQIYLPSELEEARYYEPTKHGFESQLTPRLELLRSLLGR